MKIVTTVKIISSIIVFLVIIAHNVLQLPEVRVGNRFLPKSLLTKLNVYWPFAKRKLINCLPLLQMLCRMPAFLVGAVSA
jgi:hypothetical protein